MSFPVLIVWDYAEFSIILLFVQSTSETTDLAGGALITIINNLIYFAQSSVYEFRQNATPSNVSLKDR